MRYIGIDPGSQKGGIALITENGNYIASAILDGPHNLAVEIRNWLHAWNSPPMQAIVEQQHAFPGGGASTAFKQAQNYGEILGVLAALEIPHELIAAGEWKAAMGLTVATPKVDITDIVKRRDELKAIRASLDFEDVDRVKAIDHELELLVEVEKRRKREARAKVQPLSKAKSLEMARRLWPTAPLARAKDDGVAEALLIAEYLRRRERGTK